MSPMCRMRDRASPKYAPNVWTNIEPPTSTAWGREWVNERKKKMIVNKKENVLSNTKMDAYLV